MLGVRSCKVHKTLMKNPIVDQCALYVMQTAYTAHVAICGGLPNMEVLSTYMQMINRIIMALTTPLLMCYLVAYYIYLT